MLKTRYWSDTAQHEFAALFEDGEHAPAFMEKVAEALIRGWPPNRDKPLWALGLLVAALGRSAPRAPSGLELLSAEPGEILGRLRALAAQDRCGVAPTPTVAPAAPLAPTVALADGGGVRLSAGEASIVVGRTRVALLRKVAEFLIAADGYGHAGEVMATLARLAAEPEALGEGVRALSRRLYAYRKAHFAEGHAASSFDYVRRSFAAGTVDDAAILALWTAPDNTHFATYRTALLAALAFLALRREAEVRGAVVAAVPLDAPASERAQPPREADEADLSPLALASTAEADEASLAALKATDLNVFTKAEIDFCELLAGAWPEGGRHLRSVLRLMAFHPIQSGLSNMLRTGRAKVPVETRVTCVEAADYHEIAARLEALNRKAAAWLAVAYSLAADTPRDAAAAAIAEAGAAHLARSRSKSFQRPRGELAALFAEIGASLAALSRLTGEAADAIAAYDRRAAGRLAAAFEADRPVFAEQFAKRYLEADR